MKKQKKICFCTLLFCLFFSYFAIGSSGGIKTVSRKNRIKLPVAEKKEEPPKEEPKKEIVQPVVEEKKEDPVEEEYHRSVGELKVSRDTFENDKRIIMKKIDELSLIMADKNYKAWRGYIDSESLTYWGRISNLKKAQSKLPIKGLQLKTLEDYFKYVFVPSRVGRIITEIRYISDKSVKAIEIEESQDVVYYYFYKVNGEWMVHLPAND